MRVQVSVSFYEPVGGETVLLKQHHNIYTTALKINSVCCSHAVLTAYFCANLLEFIQTTIFGSCGHFWARSVAGLESSLLPLRAINAAAQNRGPVYSSPNVPPSPKHFPLRSPPTLSAFGWQSSEKHATSLWSPFPHCPRSIFTGAMEAHCLHPLTVSMVEPHKGGGGLKRVSRARGPRHHKSGEVQS